MASVTIADYSAADLYPFADEPPPYSSSRRAEPQYSTPVDITTATTLRLDLAISKLEVPGTSITPQLDLAIEHGPTSDGPWSTLLETRRFHSTGSTRICVGGADQYVRTKWTLHGAAVARFVLDGEALP